MDSSSPLDMSFLYSFICINNYLSDSEKDLFDEDLYDIDDFTVLCDPIDEFTDLHYMEPTHDEKTESDSKHLLIRSQTNELEKVLANLRRESKASSNVSEVNKFKLKKVIVKAKISFLNGFKPIDIGKEKNSTQIIKYAKSDKPSKEIAVIKLPVKETAIQSIGISTQTSQRSIIAGAGNLYREACAGSAGFLIADKFHNELISYLMGLKESNLPSLLDPCTFTPMIAGITSFIDYELNLTPKCSIAVFCKDSIEADVAHQIAGILNKKLNQKEILKYQLFIIYDYLLGNTDRHEGNWMIKLSYNGKILSKHDLEAIVKEEGYDVNKLMIEEIIPIDNGNILPKQLVNSMICDSKQYQWKDLKFSTYRFSMDIINFLKICNLNDAWVDEICRAVNTDPEIRELCKDVSEAFIDAASITQMKLRVGQINRIVKMEIKTPKELAEASFS